jgi:hypothetical protein
MAAAVNDQSGNVDKGAFGFEEGSEYTMTEFKRKVDQFNKVVCLRKSLESLAEVEEYYWRVVTTGEENLTVEYEALASATNLYPQRYARSITKCDTLCMYGNDLDVGTYSSAFPKPQDEFGQHPWNLNQVGRINFLRQCQFCRQLVCLCAPNCVYFCHALFSLLRAAASRDRLTPAQHDL